MESEEYLRNYIKELERRNEELQETLIMAEADLEAYKAFRPWWVKSTHEYNTYYLLAHSFYAPRMAPTVLAEVKESKGVSVDKTWMAHVKMYKHMEFYVSVEEAKRAVEAMIMDEIRFNSSQNDYKYF